VKVEYEDLPVIVTIDEAIEQKSFFPIYHELKDGNLEEQKTKSDVHVSGTVYSCGQEHFYLETNCSVAFPKDTVSLEIYSSTQNVNETQLFAASVCGIPANRIAVKCKRMGGGFGGKETRTVPYACVAALAAYTLNRPVSITLDRDVDMSITGQRHAFRVDYEAGCSKDGKLTYLSAQLYNNAGYSLDCSHSVIDRALFHIDNCYKWPAFHGSGKICQTNQPSHTAFRGFGGPQAMLVTETIITQLADALKILPEELRARNLYQETYRTHFGQLLEDWYIPRLWQNINSIASIPERLKSIEVFNRTHQYCKRGFSLLPTKYGINCTAKVMNQGGALVHVYLDGSVLVAHGGTEMGQGLFTKVIQVAADCFNIPVEMVITSESSTATVANAAPTAGSTGTDMYGMAVMDACHQILDRLKPIREKLPKETTDWKTLVHQAHMERIDLSAHGFYKIDDSRSGFDWNKQCENNSERGHPYNYFTQGVGCAEVEVDCLTGDHKVLRVDILMDVGKSINPAIDIGQIEGAFVQGMGWLTIEELIRGTKSLPWIKEGQLFTRGPGAYKIPAFNDVPNDFRVHLADTNNRFAVHSSKAIGEPPLFLSASVFFAIKVRKVKQQYLISFLIFVFVMLVRMQLLKREKPMVFLLTSLWMLRPLLKEFEWRVEIL
jgi:xanthine dehydrogenase/oxidase